MRSRTGRGFRFDGFRSPGNGVIPPSAKNLPIHDEPDAGRSEPGCSPVVDSAPRYGGEEFVLVLPETNLEDGLAVAEKLRVATHRPRSAPTASA